MRFFLLAQTPERFSDYLRFFKLILSRASNIALVGNPNSGKSSLFNALTGLNQKVGNFPGVTVDKKTGKSVLPDKRAVTIVDLPGTYSLYPKSDDETVTVDVLFDEDPALKIDLVIVVADASNLKRNLLFCSQIIDIKKPVIIALTMLDIAKRKGTEIDLNGLSRELGFPVLAINPRNNKGIPELKKQIEASLSIPFVPNPKDFIDNEALSPQTVAAVRRTHPELNAYAAIHFASAFDRGKTITQSE